VSVSAALSKVLAATRPAFNARVATVRRAQSSFDEQVFSAIVTELLDPVAASVEAAAPERTAAVVQAGFDIALTLAARRLAGPGARRDFVDRLWREVMPGLARPVSERPRALLGGLTNAVLNIAATSGARPGEWLDLMTNAAPLATSATLLEIGQVLAWRAGMSHYRDGALNAADLLPPATSLALLNAKGDWTKVRARLAEDRWWRPDRDSAASEDISIGGFTGFGGPFSHPPKVCVGPEGFVVRSGERTLLLVADCYGATLHPVSPESFDALPDRPAALDAKGVRVGDRVVPLTIPRQGLSTAADKTAVVVASDYSYDLKVLPWRRP